VLSGDAPASPLFIGAKSIVRRCAAHCGDERDKGDRRNRYPHRIACCGWLVTFVSVAGNIARRR
jgi:hypothetical protein